MKTRHILWAILALFLALPHSGTAQTPEDDPFHVPTLTLSKGKYIEIHDQDSIVQIGRALLNVKTQQLVGWAEEDTTYGNDAFQADVASRWLSPDPKSDEFSGWSPYAFAFNNPILFIDPDGQAPKLPPVFDSQSFSQTLLQKHSGSFFTFSASQSSSLAHLQKFAWSLENDPTKIRYYSNNYNKVRGMVGQAVVAEKFLLSGTHGIAQGTIWMNMNNPQVWASAAKGLQLQLEPDAKTDMIYRATPTSGEQFNHAFTTFNGGYTLEIQKSYKQNTTFYYEIKTLKPNEFTARHLQKGITQLLKNPRLANGEVPVLVTDTEAWNHARTDESYRESLIHGIQQLEKMGGGLYLIDDLSRNTVEEMGDIIKTIQSETSRPSDGYFDYRKPDIGK